MNKEIIDKLIRSSCKDDILLAVEFLVEQEGQKGAMNLIKIHYYHARKECGNTIGWFNANEYRIFAGGNFFVVRLLKKE